MLVTSLSLTAEFINNDTCSSAFIYGLMSFTDKLLNGVGVFLIQHLTPETETECGDFYSKVILYACGGATILVILVTFTLSFVTIGVRIKLNENKKLNV